MKGGGAAGVATLGAAGVEVALSVLTETQTAVLQLAPYLDTLRWVFIAVALEGHRSDDLCPLRRLAPGATVIGTLLGRIVTSPWMRAALRYEAIALAVLLFLLSLRRSGERAGRLSERLETTEKANDV
jgi:hypothetical protein